MFKSGESQTDDLLFEIAVIASEIDDGIPFEESINTLKKTQIRKAKVRNKC